MTITTEPTVHDLVDHTGSTDGLATGAVDTPVTAGAANMYGAFSIESFAAQSPLTYTHEDAQGFLAYVEQFAPRNYWYQDANVRVWAYQETYDDYQGTYGMDAVRVPYHSGHGGMDGNGVFFAPMGSAWAGNDLMATSRDMRLGNEKARYVFWSTCSSLRVLGGNDPVRTWGAANLGLRMIFGFETTSVDSPDYGRNFWNHWRNGETFTSAWLNASWDIAHDQAPSVVACGANQAEADARLRTERTFFDARPTINWWSWQWYNAAASAARDLRQSVPEQVRTAVLAPLSTRRIAEVADRFGVDAGLVAAAGPGSTAVGGPERRVAIGDGGLITAHLAAPAWDSTAELTSRAAVSIAGDAISRYGLEDEAPLVLDRVVTREQAGAASDGSARAGSRVVETVVQYRQLIDDVAVITPDAGVVRVCIDNEGTVTRVQSTARRIDGVVDRPIRTVAAPARPGRPSSASSSSPDEARSDPDRALAQSFGASLRSMLVRGGSPVGYSVVPGTREIGYDFGEDRSTGTDVGRLVARQAMELEFEGGFRKRIWVTADLSR